MTVSTLDFDYMDHSDHGLEQGLDSEKARRDIDLLHIVHDNHFNVDEYVQARHDVI